MKKLLLLLIIPLLSFGQDDYVPQSKLNLGQDEGVKRVYINYKNPINGYKINIIWTPRLEWFGKVGRAVIEFIDLETRESSALINNYYLLNKKIADQIVFKNVDDWDGMKIEKNYFFNVNYSAPDFNTHFLHENPEDPFFFLDINYDGKDEFFFFEWGQSQRGSPNIVVKKLTYDNHWRLPDWINCCSGMPDLDGLSYINYDNKTIRKSHSGGASDSFETFYEFIDGKWVKVRIE